MIRQTIKKLIAKIIGNEPQTQTSNVFVAETQNIVQNNSGTINYNNVSSKTDDVDKSSKRSKVYMFTIAIIVIAILSVVFVLNDTRLAEPVMRFWKNLLGALFNTMVIHIVLL